MDETKQKTGYNKIKVNQNINYLFNVLLNFKRLRLFQPIGKRYVESLHIEI